jgi:hypothetical protein
MIARIWLLMIVFFFLYLIRAIIGKFIDFPYSIRAGFSWDPIENWS